MLEFSGVSGISLKRLFSFNWKEFYHVARGFWQQKAREEHWHRMGAYTTLATLPRSKNSPKLPSISEFWPIPLIDGQKDVSLERNMAKDWYNKALTAWRLR